MSEQNTSQIITAVHDWCQKRPIRLCVLFGSQATGQTHPGSDVDLAVWPSDSSDSAESPDSGTKLGWLVELQNLLDKEVSLALVSSNLDPVLGMEIVQDGRVIFSAEANLWHKERVRLWHAYNDSLPFRRAAREQMRHFARGLTHDQ
jgi:predicted nucleotidyltransferase